MNLSKEDMKRLSKDGIEYLISVNDKRLKVWSLPKYERNYIENDILQLKSLLENVSRET